MFNLTKERGQEEMSQQNRVTYTTLCPREHTQAGEYPVWFDMDEKTYGCDGPTEGPPHRFDSLPGQQQPEAGQAPEAATGISPNTDFPWPLTSPQARYRLRALLGSLAACG